MDHVLPIVEIFDSIQGEGCHLGKAATFIRTSGCNLKCPWCDTKDSWGGHSEVFTIPEIVERVNCSMVVITGGEPTLHGEALHVLVDALKAKGCMVCIETNGTNPVYHMVDWVTCSPKAEADYFIHPDLRPNELKYVVDAHFDAEYAIPEAIRTRYAGKIWLQPEGNNMQQRWIDCYALAAGDERLRVGVQLHKIMEVQ